MSNAILKILPNHSDKLMLKHISQNKFAYTDNSDATTIYLVFKSYSAYKKASKKTPHKLIRSNSFYIAKLI